MLFLKFDFSSSLGFKDDLSTMFNARRFIQLINIGRHLNAIEYANDNIQALHFEFC